MVTAFLLGKGRHGVNVVKAQVLADWLVQHLAMSRFVVLKATPAPPAAARPARSA